MEESPEDPVTWPGWDALRPDSRNKEADALQNEIKGLRTLLEEAEGAAIAKDTEIDNLQRREAELEQQLEQYARSINDTEGRYSFLRSSLAAIVGDAGPDDVLVKTLEMYVLETHALRDQNIAYRDLEAATRSLLAVADMDVSTLDALDALLREAAQLRQSVACAEEAREKHLRENKGLAQECDTLKGTVGGLEQLLEAARRECAALTELIDTREALVQGICCLDGFSFEDTCRYIRDKLLVYGTYEEGNALLVSELTLLKEAIQAVATDGAGADTSCIVGETGEGLERIKHEFGSSAAKDANISQLRGRIKKLEQEILDKNISLCNVVDKLLEADPSAAADPENAVESLLSDKRKAEGQCELLSRECAVLRRKLDAARKDTREATEATISSAVTEVKTAKRLKEEQGRHTAFLETLSSALGMKEDVTLDTCVQQIKHIVQDRRRLNKAQKEAQTTIGSLRDTALRLKKERDDVVTKFQTSKSSVGKLTKQLKEARNECKIGSERCTMFETALREHERERMLCTGPRSPPTPPTPPCEVAQTPVSPASEMPQGSNESIERTVCVVGLDASLSEDELLDFAQECGRLQRIRLCSDGNACYGFFEYLTKDEAWQLVAKDKATLGRRVVSCSWSKSAISSEMMAGGKVVTFRFVYCGTAANCDTAERLERRVVSVACNTEYVDEEDLRRQVEAFRHKEADYRRAEMELRELGFHSNEAIRVIRELLEEREMLVREKESLSVLQASTGDDRSARMLEDEVQVLADGISQIAVALNLHPDAAAANCVTAVRDLMGLCSDMSLTCGDLRKSVAEYKNLAIEASKPRMDASSSSHDRVEVACGGREHVPRGEVPKILMSLGLKETLPLVTSMPTVSMKAIEAFWKQFFYKHLTTSLMDPRGAAQSLTELLRVTAKKAFLKDLLFEWYLCSLPPYVPPRPTEIDAV